jgi:hypothetical protein
MGPNHKDEQDEGHRLLTSVPITVRPSIKKQGRKLNTVPRDVRPIDLTPKSLGRKLNTVPRNVRPIDLTPKSLGRKLHGNKHHTQQNEEKR